MVSFDWVTRHWKEGLLFFTSVSVALACVEVVLRIQEPSTTWFPSADIDRPLTPNSEGLLLGRRVTINNQGYRAKAYPQNESPEHFRILVFGDSFTFGMGADDLNTFPAHLERMLTEQRCDTCEVLNFGVPGYDLRQNAAMARKRMSEYETDLILFVYHSGALENVDIFKGNQRQDISGEKQRTKFSVWDTLNLWKRRLEEHSALAAFVIPRLSALTRKLTGFQIGRTWDEEREVLGNGKLWLEAFATLRALKHQSEQAGIRFLVVLFPNLVKVVPHPASATFSEMDFQLESDGIQTVNLLSVFSGRGSELSASLLDGHPNEEGYELAAKEVYNFLVDEPDLGLPIIH